MQNMLMGAERMGLGDACHSYVCHLRFLSELALLDFGVDSNLTRAYPAQELRCRRQELYVIVYRDVKGANWPIFFPKDFVLRVNFEK